MDEINDSWWRKRLRRFEYAANGWREVLRSELNARFHLLASVAVVALAAWFSITAAEWIWIVSAIALVWITELLNTAVEELCDMIQPMRDDRIKRIKDMCAGAVLIASLYALIVGIAVFIPYVRSLWQ